MIEGPLGQSYGVLNAIPASSWDIFIHHET
jgi:hypothetical protein